MSEKCFFSQASMGHEDTSGGWRMGQAVNIDGSLQGIHFVPAFQTTETSYAVV